MCLACEEQEYFFRVWCAGFLARGEIPPGVTSEDLQALGLAPPEPSAGGGKPFDQLQRKRRASSADADSFACDNPDE